MAKGGSGKGKPADSRSGSERGSSRAGKRPADVGERAAPAADRLESPDRRRVLPTQDWVSHVDKAHLEALAQTQVLAATHFYDGLKNLKEQFTEAVLLPPPEHDLPTSLHGTVRLPDGTAGSQLAVSVLPFVDASGASVQVTQMAITDERGEFTLTELPAAKVADKTAIPLQFRGANGKERRDFTMEPSNSAGILGEVQLRLALAPLQKSVVASLRDVVGGIEASMPEASRPGTADQPITLQLGDEA